jgi:ankyrin repeat protein
VAASNLTTDPLWYDLRNSVYAGQFAHAEDLLAANSCLFDLCNSIGETVLHFLAVENDLGGVEWLYARGFSLNAKNRFGTPMIFEAAAVGHKELLLWLFQRGADFSILDSKQRDILAYLRRNLAYLRNIHDERRIRRVEEMSQFLLENIPQLRIGDSAGC